MAIVGLLLLVPGLTISVVPIVYNAGLITAGKINFVQMLTLLPGMIVALIVGLPMAATGWAIAFLRVDFTFDQDRKLIRKNCDCLLFKRTSDYVLTKNHRVVIEALTRQNDTMQRTYVHVIAKSADAELFLLTEPISKMELCSRFAVEIAEFLQIPLEDRAHLSVLSNQQPARKWWQEVIVNILDWTR